MKHWPKPQKDRGREVPPPLVLVCVYGSCDSFPRNGVLQSMERGSGNGTTLSASSTAAHCGKCQSITEAVTSRLYTVVAEKRRGTAVAMETPTSSTSASITSITELLNFPGSVDLLDDMDFESTMMLFDNAATPGGSSGARRHSVEPLDFSLTNLVDVFSHNDAEALDIIKEEPQAPPHSSYMSSDVKLRINGRISATGQSAGGMFNMKQEFGAAPELSPLIDSFLRESWEDIVDAGSKHTRPSWKLAPNPPSINIPPTTAPLPARVAPLPHSFILPSPIGVASQSATTAKLTRSITTTKKKATAVSAATQKQPATPTQAKTSRRAKQCVAEGCDRRAQSNNRCKTHGGGARCQMQGCDKSSQGGGLCRAHGGGKKCRVPGCSKGTQRLGLCYLHGGIRRCITEGCKKKDRGNGYCISHGGGRRCEVAGCDRSVRKGNRCQTHQSAGDESPFQITRRQGLAFP